MIIEVRKMKQFISFGHFKLLMAVNVICKPGMSKDMAPPNPMVLNSVYLIQIYYIKYQTHPISHGLVQEEVTHI